jgi:hypothetical protein
MATAHESATLSRFPRFQMIADTEVRPVGLARDRGNKLNRLHGFDRSYVANRKGAADGEDRDERTDCTEA